MAFDLQLAFGAGMISQALWGRVELTKYDSACKRLINAFTAPEGGALNRPGTRFLLPLKDMSRKARLIPFKFNTKQAYMLEFSHFTMRIIKDGGYVLEPAKTISAVTQADPGVVTANAHGYATGDVVQVRDVVGMTQLNGQIFTVGAVTTNTFELEGIDTTGYGAYVSGGTVARVATIPSPYSEDDLALLKYTQSNDTMTFTKVDHENGTDMEERKLVRTDHHVWTFSIPTFTPNILPPAGAVNVVATVGTGTVTYRYVVTAVAEDTEEESLQSAVGTITNNLATAGNKNTISWTAVAGAAKYNVYKDDNTTFGFIGQSTSTSFVDDNIAADLEDTPPQSRNPFVGAGNRPGCATFYQQRLARAGTYLKPSTFDLSQIGLFYNMSVTSPAKASDAIQWTINDTESNEIRHMRALKKDLFLFTSGGIWVGTTGGEPVKIDTLSVDRQETWGVGHVPPLLIGNEFLFVQDDYATVRSTKYSFESDSYTGSELNLLARDLFELRGIKEWAFARDPFRVVWCVMDDGTLLGLTYVRDQEMYAWHFHSTDGEFESVGTIPEGKEYGVYFVVKRMVNGQPVRYVERMASRRFTDKKDAFFLDCGGTYVGEPTKTIKVGSYLEGKTVGILADGGTEPDQVVTNGLISITNPASKIHYGLKYISDIEPVGVDLRGDPSALATKKTITDILIRVRDTIGLFAGPNENNLTEYKQRSDEPYGSGVDFANGQLPMSITSEWGYDCSVLIRQTYPLPIHVLGIAANVSTTGERDGSAITGR